MTAPLTASMPAAADALPLLPEIVLVAGAFALLILDLFIDKRHKIVTQTISVGLLLAVLGMVLAGCGGQGVVFDGMFVRDAASDVHVAYRRDEHSARVRRFVALLRATAAGR